VVRRAIRSVLAAIAMLALASCSAHSPKGAAHGASTAASTIAPSGDLLSDVRERGSLVIATDPNYSPQSLRAPDGSWSGFDVEVGREIARRLGVKPVFDAANFDLVVRGHWLGQWDVNVGSMSITNERTKVLWFTKSYYLVPGLFAVRSSSSVNSLGDLAGKRVGVTAATTFQDYVKGRLPGKVSVAALHLNAVPYDSDVHALQDLVGARGRSIDAVFTSLPTLQSAVAKGMPIRIVGKPVFEDRAAIALDRSSFHVSLGLLFAIDSIIDAMHKDGTLRRLSIKYYGQDLSSE
jgi:polar amino acid transport system substrate-binding protein